MTITPKRRWFQFSLKAMLVVTTLACVTFAWFANERSELQRRKATVAAIEELGGDVIFDESQRFRSTWLRPLLGDNMEFEVVGVNFFRGDKVTNTEFAHAVGLSETDWRYDTNTLVTDASLTHLESLTNLEKLCLNRTQVTDLGLIHVAGLRQLEMLDLEHTPVTDAGLVRLAGLTKLKVLSVKHTQVTEKGVNELKKGLPSLLILR